MHKIKFAEIVIILRFNLVLIFTRVDFPLFVKDYPLEMNTYTLAYEDVIVGR